MEVVEKRDQLVSLLEEERLRFRICLGFIFLLFFFTYFSDFLSVYFYIIINLISFPGVYLISFVLVFLNINFLYAFSFYSIYWSLFSATSDTSNTTPTYNPSWKKKVSLRLPPSLMPPSPTFHSTPLNYLPTFNHFNLPPYFHFYPLEPYTKISKNSIVYKFFLLSFTSYL